jgi:hypothetical protein
MCVLVLVSSALWTSWTYFISLPPQHLVLETFFVPWFQGSDVEGTKFWNVFYFPAPWPWCWTPFGPLKHTFCPFLLSIWSSEPSLSLGSKAQMLRKRSFEQFFWFSWSPCSWCRMPFGRLVYTSCPFLFNIWSWEPSLFLGSKAQMLREPNF